MPSEQEVEAAARAICETLFGPYDPASAGPNLMFTTEAQSLRAATAALAAAEAVRERAGMVSVQQWRDVETDPPPKDGRFLVLDHGEVYVAHGWTVCAASHWMPLPAATGADHE